MNPDKPGEDSNAGEGDRTWPRRYKRDREFVAGGAPTKVTVDELVAKGRTLVDRVESFVHRITGRFGRRSHR